MAAADVRAGGRLSHALLLGVFTGSVFTSAFLLFLVQPLFGRMVLPRLGGSPAVWNACMLFFQAALLGGYLYAHVSTRLLRPRAQVATHLGLMACAALALPISLGDRYPAGTAEPVSWLLGVMLLTVGPPFLVLSGTGPLLQRWFSLTAHRHAADPYPLYAASNVGSALALFAYPALVEPRLRLAAQSLQWAFGYGALAALILGCAAALRGSRPAPAHEQPAAASGGAVSAADRVRWIALAFVPSSMLLGVTSYLTSDLAPIPLLWVLPLGLYLFSFTLVFARRPLIPHEWMVLAQPSLLAVAVLMLLEGLMTRPGAAIALHLAGLMVTAMVCHGELARRRPPVRHLTEFYLLIAVGGVLGGVLNVIVAPLVFTRLWEYPLIVVAACLARPWPRGEDRRAQLRPALFAALAAAALLWAVAQELGVFTLGALAATALAMAVLTMELSRWPLWLAAALGTVLAVRTTHNLRTDGTILATRSFFGAYRVEYVAGEGGHHTFMHGSTLHGAQSRDPRRRREPQSYYLRGGPVGQVFAALRAAPGTRRVAFIGLGTGTAATYGAAGDRWDYYELDPGIERVARDTALFTFLADSPARIRVLLGDARLSMQHAPDAGYDLIALDAFTSDAIPTHLLTREALALYLRKLAPGGVITYHISNRYLNLEPVVDALARDRGLVAWVGSGPNDRPGRFDQYATWIVIARRPADLGALTRDPAWSEAQGGEGLAPWTDDYSSVLSVMRW